MRLHAYMKITNCNKSLSKLYYYFDPWAVAKTDERGEHINSVILRPIATFKKDVSEKM